MNSGSIDLTLWAEKELRLINHLEIFQAKPAILKKVEYRLVALQKSLEEEITLATLPQGVDLTRNQIARGENHNGFPYLSLDYPQNFSKTEMFTFRTLFWWGHYLGFSLILKGEHLESYVDRLSENRNTEPFKDIYFSLASNPWEWEINENNFSLAHQCTINALQKKIIELGYLKIIRVFPVTNEKFATLNWIQVGIQFWKDLTPVTLGK
jgi:hypothetical protein